MGCIPADSYVVDDADGFVREATAQYPNAPPNPPHP